MEVIKTEWLVLILLAIALACVVAILLLAGFVSW